jgi:hypothetical protein
MVDKVLNRLTQNKFRVVIPEAPITAAMTRRVNLGEVTLEPAEANYRLLDVKLPGEKFVFQTLELEVMMDENFDTYAEIWSWMRKMADVDVTDPELQNRDELFCDIDIIMYKNSGQFNRRFTYTDCWPTRIDVFEMGTDDAEYSFFTVGFYFTTFDISSDEKNTLGVENITYSH